MSIRITALNSVLCFSSCGRGVSSLVFPWFVAMLPRTPDSADIPLSPSLARLKKVTAFMFVGQELLSNIRNDLRLKEQKEEKRRSSSSKQDDDLEEQSVRLCLFVIMAIGESAHASSPAIPFPEAIGAAQASKALSASEGSGREKRKTKTLFSTSLEQDQEGPGRERNRKRRTYSSGSTKEKKRRRMRAFSSTSSDY